MKHPITYRKQTEDHTCGLCVAWMVCKYFGLPTRALRDMLGVDFTLPVFIPGRASIETRFTKRLASKKGTWPIDLTLALRHLGLKTTRLGIRKQTQAKQLETYLPETPVIALVDDWSHWVVLHGITAQCYWVADPSLGLLRPRKDTFLKERLTLSWAVLF